MEKFSLYGMRHTQHRKGMGGVCVYLPPVVLGSSQKSITPSLTPISSSIYGMPVMTQLTKICVSQTLDRNVVFRRTAKKHMRIYMPDSPYGRQGLDAHSFLWRWIMKAMVQIGLEARMTMIHPRTFLGRLQWRMDRATDDVRAREINRGVTCTLSGRFSCEISWVQSPMLLMRVLYTIATRAIYLARAFSSFSVRSTERRCFFSRTI